MIPGAFDYHRPQSVDEAVGLLSDHAGDAFILAGGHSLIPMMKLRMATPEHLIDIQDIDELTGLDTAGDVITIGAAVTQARIIGSNDLADACPILRETALQ
ncbi:MAG: FAD binding domain-containing protein, partial [Pseudomonadota bacterium]